MKIALNMIVKNEAHVLRRALESAKPFVNEFVLLDTGSTDGTQEIIKEYGELYEAPWSDFATARNQALELARKTQCSYALFLDADDVMEKLDNDPAQSLLALSLPAYTLPVHYGNTVYTRCALIKLDQPWAWKGVLHEYLDSPYPLEQGHLEQPIIKILGGGARSLDPEKYKKDAALLEAAIATDPNPRYVFYLAQSYKDAGEPEKALAMYHRRTQMVGWVEETWYAMYMKAQITEWLGRDPTLEYLQAYNYRPHRIEPLYMLSKYYRLKNQHALSYLFSKRGVETPRVMDALFVDVSIYDWRLLEELALNAYYVGAKEEGKATFKRMITEAKAPEEDVTRFKESLKWY